MKQDSFSTTINHGEQLRTLQESRGAADTTRILLHDVVSFTPGEPTTATVPGKDRDIEKGLVVARPQDLVCISPNTHSGQLEYLTRLGLGPSSQNIIRLTGDNPSCNNICHAQSLLEMPELLDEICSRIRCSGPIILEPYIITPECIRLADELQARTARTVRVSGENIDLVNRCIQKHWIKTQASELGVPVAEGDAVEVERSPIGRPVDLQPLREAVKHWIRLSGAIVELYDVNCIAGVTRPMAIGLVSDEIRRMLSLPRA